MHRRWNYIHAPANPTAVSVNIETKIVDRGSDEHVGEAWDLKEKIRESDGVLRQRRGFFRDAYRRSTTYLYTDRSSDRLVGFAAVRRDGYILFLAVDEEYRGHGFGKRLVARVAEDYGSVTCHARATNREALGFYQHIGFEIRRRIDNYYEDGGDAYYLKLGEDSIKDKLSKYLPG
nr:N-acetyltransferase [Haloarcula salina]